MPAMNDPPPSPRSTPTSPGAEPGTLCLRRGASVRPERWKLSQKIGAGRGGTARSGTRAAARPHCALPARAALGHCPFGSRPSRAGRGRAREVRAHALRERQLHLAGHGHGAQLGRAAGARVVRRHQAAGVDAEDVVPAVRHALLQALRRLPARVRVCSENRVRVDAEDVVPAVRRALLQALRRLLARDRVGSGGPHGQAAASADAPCLRPRTPCGSRAQRRPPARSPSWRPKPPGDTRRGAPLHPHDCRL